MVYKSVSEQKWLKSLAWVLDRTAQVDSLDSLVVTSHQLFIYGESLLKRTLNQDAISRHLVALTDFDQISDQKFITRNVLNLLTISIDRDYCYVGLLGKLGEATLLLPLQPVLECEHRQNDK
jgi:hypothetical protein